MKILAISRVLDSSNLEQIKAMLVEEERYAWQSYLDGVLREHYESDMPYAAISVLELESIEAAREFFKDLPLLKAGLMSVEFFPLRPFRNWDVLFRDEERLSAQPSKD